MATPSFLYFFPPPVQSHGGQISCFENGSNWLEEMLGQSDKTPNADAFYPAMIRSRKSIYKKNMKSTRRIAPVNSKDLPPFTKPGLTF